MTIAERLSAALADRYRIERELGAGGMATVYLAADLKHDRKVAIKVLKPELAAVLGAERFLAEIRTTANLQHPHILPLHDSGAADGTVFYVMPYVEGETVRDHLSREKQLPVAEAVRIATEVAGALDYAHRRGVIHRDVKPENILLQDGSALVSDFGIALAASNIGGGRLTETGMSLGTPHYMSPEQALGEREITARSDVYALGCVLYEMVTGEPPFTGPTAQAIIAKLMADDPRPPSQLRKTLPPNVEAAILTALAKLPADRFASAAAFADALANPGYRAVGGIPGLQAGSAGRSPAARAVAAFSWVALGALGTWLGLRPFRSATTTHGYSQLQITYSGRAGSPATSPDGRFVAFLEERCPEPPAAGGCLNLEVLEIGSTNPVEIITGATRLAPPRWTHDGLALVVGGALDGGLNGLFVVARLGGTPRRFADLPAAYDTHPAADSVVLVLNGPTGARLRLMAIGGGEAAGREDSVGAAVRDIAWSPDGRMFALSDVGNLRVLRRDGWVLTQREQTMARAPVRWSEDGRHLLTFRWGAGHEDDLIALPVGRDGTIGEPRVLASQMRTLLLGRFDVARANGRLVLGTGAITTDLWSFDLEGQAVRSRRLTQGSNWYGAPVLSADAGSLYFLRTDALGNNLYSITGGRERALTAERQIVNNSGRLSVDGEVFAYEAYTTASQSLVVSNLRGGTSRRIPRGPEDIGWVTRAGQSIVWLDASTGSGWVTDSAGHDRRPLAVPSIGKVDMTGGWMLAPDGKSMAVVGARADGFTVVQVPLDGSPAVSLGHFPATAGEVANRDNPQFFGIGLAGWSRDGIYLARAGTSPATTRIVRLDPATMTVRQVADLPVGCAPRTVSVSAGGRKAACMAPDQRGDLIVIEGLRP